MRHFDVTLALMLWIEVRVAIHGVGKVELSSDNGAAAQSISEVLCVVAGAPHHLQEMERSLWTQLKVPRYSSVSGLPAGTDKKYFSSHTHRTKTSVYGSESCP